MSHRYTVLVVEDDRTLRDLLVEILEQRRYSVVTACDGAAARACLDDDAADLMLLDLRLPDEDGLDLIKAIRQTNAIPIVVCSARHAVDVRIEALRAGADDYITKPFDLDDLEARIETVLRRSPKLEPTAPELHYDTLVLAEHRMPTIDGETFYVTPKQYALLSALVARAPAVISVHDISKALGHNQCDVYIKRLVRMLVRRLRAVLRTMPSAPTIHNDYGYGYRMAPAMNR